MGMGTRGLPRRVPVATARRSWQVYGQGWLNSNHVAGMPIRSPVAAVRIVRCFEQPALGGYLSPKVERQRKPGFAVLPLTLPASGERLEALQNNFPSK